MSIICTTYIPGGIVIGADSRVIVNMNLTNTQDSSKKMMHTFTVSDNAQKVFLLEKVQVGIACVSTNVGDDVQGLESFIRNFEKNEVRQTDGIDMIAEKLQRAMPNNSTYHVAGYEGTEPYVYNVSKNECKRLNIQTGAVQYGITCLGEAVLFQKIMGTDPKPAINFKMYSAIDAADFTEYIIRTSIDMQKFEMRPKVTGGSIDLLVLTPEGAFWKAHKFKNNAFVPMPESQRTSVYITDKNGKTIN